MQQPVDQQLIKRYLKGDCTPVEYEQIKAFIKSGNAQPLFDEVLNEGWTEETEKTDADQLQLWKTRFQQKLENIEKDNIRSVKRFPWLKYAAVWAILVLGIGSYAWLHYQEQAQGFVAMQETANPNGKLLRIKLGDNTTIILNAASKLKYPAHFNGKTREVYLEGEAFFDVAHDSAHPFIVHTSKIRVSVLGTSFDVRSYKEDKEIAVTVATGKVGVLANTKGSKTHMLLPGDRLAYSITNNTPEQTRVNAGEISAWQAGMLIYHNETLENISRQIERWYDVKVVFKDETLGKMRFNLKQKNDSLDNVMQTLQFAGGIHYRISGKQVLVW